MEENHHDERALNKKELKLKADALGLAKGMVEKYVEQQPHYSYAAQALDEAFEKVMKEAWWRRPKKFFINMALGYALGQNLVDNLGFKWLVYRDLQGQDVAVKHEGSGLICFPISAVRKRLKDKKYTFMENYIKNIKAELTAIAKAIPKLQYISQEKEGLTHLQAIENACQAGCEWLQLRMKGASFQEFLDTAIAAKKICQQYQAKLTINDNPQVALESGADGLHLGKQDMPPSEARKMLGDIIIGGTANTWEDILHLAKEGVDYIGLGPFRFTSTKKNLSPVLGIEGYDALLRKMTAANIDIPVLAIGGIELEDVGAILDTGVWGIAVSGLITNAEDRRAVCAAICERMLD